jgi:hypothetical protein
MESEWSTDIDEAPAHEVSWLTVKVDGVITVQRTTVAQSLDDGFEVIAWKRTEYWPKPYAPTKPEQVKGWQEGGLVVFDSAVTPIFCDSVIDMIQMVEKRTREIVEWEQKYEI